MIPRYWLAAVCLMAINAGAYDMLECDGAGMRSATVICENAGLASRNRNLNYAYRSILERGTAEQINRADTLLERHASSREQCNADTVCLVRLYNESLGSLVDFHNLEVVDNPCLFIRGNAHTENACGHFRAMEAENSLNAAFEKSRDEFVAFHQAGKQLSDTAARQFRNAKNAEFEAWKAWRDARCNLLLMPGYGGQATTNSFCLLEMNEQRIRHYEAQTQNPEEAF